MHLVTSFFLSSQSVLCHVLGSHPRLPGRGVPARGTGGPGVESSALTALHRDRTRGKAHVLNSDIVVIRSFTPLKYWGEGGGRM